ncbi:MAG: hypothetical protein JWR22_1070 [Herminiimonas sp.]|nr:hypothetical protein [Herminiimonas sp.]
MNSKIDWIAADIERLTPEVTLHGLPSSKKLDEEHLPFTVKVVRNAVELRKAIQIRHAAYNRHVPALAEILKSAEPLDTEDGVVVLLAESKLDGSPIGTMRIQTNRYRPLSLEQSIPLPPALALRPLAEATRLGVTEERVGRLVKTVLFKAYYLYCQQVGIEWMIIAGRTPIDRQYDRLLFKDVYPDLGYVNLAYANNMPHRILSFEVNAAEANWASAHHPLFDFMVRTAHPDIDLRDSAPFVPEARRNRSITQHGMLTA